MFSKITLLIGTTMFASALLFTSCKKVVPEKELQPIESTGQLTVLGDKLKNEPYSVENVRKAFANLVEKKKSSSPSGNKAQRNQWVIEFAPTHKYVKFMPATIEQAIDLEESGLEIEDVPLDQDIEVEGGLLQGPYHH